MFFVDRVVGCQQVTHTLLLTHTCALRIEDMVQFGSICQLKKKFCKTCISCIRSQINVHVVMYCLFNFAAIKGSNKLFLIRYIFISIIAVQQ